MRKLYVLLVLALFVFPIVSAVDVAYVLRDSSRPNSVVIDSLNDLRYSYDLIDDSDVSRTDFSRYGFILLGDEKIDNVPVNNFPSLIIGSQYASTWSGSTGTRGGNAPLFALNLNEDISITKGLVGEFQVYTQGTVNGKALNMMYLSRTKVRGVERVTINGDLDHYVIAVQRDPKRVFFGFTETKYWTPESENLFERSMKWILQDEDRDGDLFFGDFDCDDSDPLVNPAAKEIPYDGKDNDCRNGDLTDVDGDGYDSEVVGGDDCNDEDPLVNPGSSDPRKNCVPDTIEPDVELISPSDGASFNVREIEFSYSVEDNTDILVCSLFSNFDGNFKIVDEREVRLINGKFEGSFVVEDIPDGNHKWNVRCDDFWNQEFASNDRTFNVDAPNAPKIESIKDKIVSEGKEISFSVDVSDKDNDLVSLIIKNLPKGAKFLNGIFSWVPNFDQSGEYNLEFEAKDSTGLKDTESVKITVRDVKQPPQFSDAPQCKKKDSRIGLRIKDPDDGDDFDVGETIDVELEIENKFKKDLDFEIEVHFYDITEENSEDDDKDDLDVDEGDEEDIEFQLKIPDDIDDGNEFAVYVFVEDEDGDFCTSGFVEIDVEREDDAVIIEKFDVNPVNANKGENVYFAVDVKNIGSDDQDVRVELKNSGLGLDLRSEIFELDEFDDKGDDRTVNFDFKVPLGVKDGVYTIVATAFFSGESVSKSLELHVGEKKIETTTTKKLFMKDNDLINLGGTISAGERNDKKVISNGTLSLGGSKKFTETSYRTKKVDEMELKDIRRVDRSSAGMVVKDTSSGYGEVGFLSSIESQFRDYPARCALWALNIILIFGIVSFIVKIIIVLRR